MSKLTTKQLGDAGEYYALSQFIFLGRAAAKMPDNWPEYDLAVYLNGELKKVSVKTRTTSKKSFSTEHCKFSANDKFDFLVCIFKSSEAVRSWIVPAKIAEKIGQIPSSSNENYRRISFKQLIEMEVYEDNWLLHSD